MIFMLTYAQVIFVLWKYSWRWSEWPTWRETEWFSLGNIGKIYSVTEAEENFPLHCTIANFFFFFLSKPLSLFRPLICSAGVWRGWLVPQLYVMCRLPYEKQNLLKFILQPKPRQLIDTQTKLREQQSAALIDGRTWKVACLFPLCDYSIKPRPVWLTGINMHGDSLSPLCFCVKRHSLSVFLCLSRCYPSVHQWTLQESGPLYLIFISLPKSKKRNPQKSICCKI